MAMVIAVPVVMYPQRTVYPTGNATGHSADNTAHDSTNRSEYPSTVVCAFMRTFPCALSDALRKRRNRHSKEGKNAGSNRKLHLHGASLLVRWGTCEKVQHSHASNVPAVTDNMGNKFAAIRCA